MKQARFNFTDEIADAVKNGDPQRVAEIYREHRSTRDRYRGYRENLSAEYFEASMTAAKQNPQKYQQDILAEILAFQTMLLHRVGESIKIAIQEHDQLDGGGMPWGWLPPPVADEMLPRFGKISAEISNTIRLIQRLQADPKEGANAAV